MIPLTFVYDEYINRSKLSEQKNPFEYIVPPPTSGVGTKKYASPIQTILRSATFFHVKETE